jgi:hypothetical protein
MKAMSREHDTAAIITVLQTLFDSVDRRDWERFKSVFCDEVDLDYGTPERVSPQQMVDRWEPLFAGLDKTEHAVSNVVVDVTGDAASARSVFRASHILEGAARGDTWVLEGRYEHELVRSSGEWRVRAMKMTPGRSTGNAAIFEDAKRR